MNTAIDLREYFGVTRFYDHYAFIKINLTQIPKGAIVTDVQFKLFYKGTWGYGASNVFLGKTSHPFTDNVSWYTYNGYNAWTSGVADGLDGYPHFWSSSPGGVLATVAGNPADIDSWKSFSSMELINHIQNLVTAGENAFLWLAHDGSNGGYQRFAAITEASYEPKIEIDWYMPVPQTILWLEGHNDVNHNEILNIMPSFTVISGTTTDYNWVTQLRNEGKIFCKHVVNIKNATVAELLAEWRQPFDSTNIPGGYDAIAIDELYSTYSDGTAEANLFCEALKQLRAAYPHKQIYVYSQWQIGDGGENSFYDDPNLSYSETLNAINNYASGHCLELYINEAHQQYNLFAAFADNIESYATGILNKTIFILFIAQHGFIADDSATVGFWGHLDEQFHRIKNNPTTAAMPGIGAWVYYRAEPETPPFFAKLINHYYINNNSSYFGDGNTENLIANPQFEPNGSTTGWELNTGSGGEICTIKYSDDNILDNHGYTSWYGLLASHGLYGLKMISGTTPNKISYSVAGLNTGMTHTVSAWVLGKYWGAKAKLTVMDAYNNVIHTESLDHVPNDDYKRIQFNFTPTTTSIKIILSDDGSIPSTRLYWDFIELEEAYNN